MKVQLLYGVDAVDEEESSELVMHHYNDAHGPHIQTVPDEHGAFIRFFYSRDEVIALKDWCDSVLRRYG